LCVGAGVCACACACVTACVGVGAVIVGSVGVRQPIYILSVLKTVLCDILKSQRFC
jgi:hypothetical protein